MYRDKKILAIIPARGGSKGIPHKNIISLCGKPLISYTIAAALASQYIDYTMVSTDDKDIANISLKCGANIPFLRPAELASDHSKTIDAVIHAIDGLSNMKMKFDTMILLQPTQPLRTTDDIDNAIDTFMESGRIPLASVSLVDNHPILTRTIEDGKLKRLLDISSTCRRQDMSPYYRINGCIYINDVKSIDEFTSFNDNPVPYIMDKSHSVDIDEFIDLVIAEYYLKRNV